MNRKTHNGNRDRCNIESDIISFRIAFIAITMGLMLILQSIGAKAVFYTDFRSPRAICTEQGLKIQTIHNGRLILPEEIKITAEDELGADFNVEGTWYADNKPVTYIVGENAASYTDVLFVSKTPFPKNENYRIFFSYKRTAEAFDYTTLQFIANCPGKLCASDINCADSEKCDNGQCRNLNCNVCQKPYLNSCVPKCSDGNVCTKDLCREGVCSYAVTPNCCVNDKACDDDLTCTNDICVNQRCAHTDVACEGTEACVSGTCEEGKGCVYDTNLTCLNEENRRYVMQLGTPKVVERETRPTNILSWILTFLKNFFG